ncbi:MAG: 7-carboxy-7-deazaguanine synthase QueE [Candidatus Omnitrophota bacterium]|nr:7-carboxy-7-deazaguanine synthase QueE [Candidatus Omnitrophota bacterium]
MVMKSAKIVEVFSSIQGEGVCLGQQQTFVRFYGCNLRCGFCDEAGKNKFKEYSGKELVKAIIKKNNRVVSLTGGEPLLYAGFLKEVLPELKKKGFIIYLETNGTLKNKLLEIVGFLDIISMDIKLPSSTGGKAFWKVHSDFLKASTRKKVFVKSVITNRTTLSDIKKAVSVIEKVNKAVFFILQPATNDDRVQKIKHIQKFLSVSSSRLDNVRLMPQVHKILGVR